MWIIDFNGCVEGIVDQVIIQRPAIQSAVICMQDDFWLLGNACGKKIQAVKDNAVAIAHVSEELFSRYIERTIIGEPLQENTCKYWATLSTI